MYTVTRQTLRAMKNNCVLKFAYLFCMERPSTVLVKLKLRCSQE